MKFKNIKCKRISRKKFDNIKISRGFQKNPPNPIKLQFYENLFKTRHKLQPIIIDENNFLVDGYCAYLIAKGHCYRGFRIKMYKVNKKV